MHRVACHETPAVVELDCALKNVTSTVQHGTPISAHASRSLTTNLALFTLCIVCPAVLFSVGVNSVMDSNGTWQVLWNRTGFSLYGAIGTGMKGPQQPPAGMTGAWGSWAAIFLAPDINQITYLHSGRVEYKTDDAAPPKPTTGMILAEQMVPLYSPESIKKAIEPAVQPLREAILNSSRLLTCGRNL